MFLQNTRPFRELKPFFLPAFYCTILDGKKKLHQLSIQFQGREIVVKKSSKPFAYAGFNQVISGAVLRMQKLFHPDKLKLEVNNLSMPTFNNLSISFELLNKKIFKIADEEYYASIRVLYSYDDCEKVTYSPIIYRKVCSNGMITVLSSKFKEIISADKIFDIGCEWTRCNFETIQNNFTRYFNELSKKKVSNDSKNQMDSISSMLRTFENIRQSRGVSENNDSLKMEVLYEIRNPEDILQNNINTIGNNEFALWNTLTEIASRESNDNARYEMFSELGKHLSEEVDKMLKEETKDRSDNLLWDEVESIANS